jgi:hypothetical protein
MKLKFTIHKDKADVAEDARTISFPGDDEASIPEPQSSPGAPYPVESSEKQSPGIMAPVAHSDQKVVEGEIHISRPSLQGKERLIIPRPDQRCHPRSLPDHGPSQFL